MSAREPEMACRKALDHLYEYLDRELSSEVEREVRGHLRACAGCAGRFGFEEAFLRFLEARTRSCGAPPALRRRILEQLLLADERAPEE